ncbi:MAG: hypothetical protein H7282_05005 [Cytophagaceae bacterium]|nr:hypothetical protein [Cytophagaceae bacterium]
MARGIENFPVHETPTSDYPSGNIKDRVGTDPGTKINKFSNGDIFQFFAKFLRILGVSPNGNPENETNGYQYVQSVIDVMHQEITDGIVRAMLDSYAFNDLIKFQGAIVSVGSIPGSSTITAGEIFYNGKLYKVPAATVITGIGDTLVFKIDNSKTPNQIYLTNGTSGIANYNATTVKNYKEVIAGIYIPLTLTGGATVLGAVAPAYRLDQFGFVRLRGAYSVPYNSVVEHFSLPISVRPSHETWYWNGRSTVGNTVVQISIATNGDADMILPTSVTSGSIEFNLEGISFKL